MRNSISKRTRFEVFKRDRFCCVYCGRTPPDVLLEVDHIIAVSKGGSDDILNLATSCKDCNAGKSNVPLAQVRVDRSQEIEERRELVEQMSAIAQLAADEQKSINDMVDTLSDLWMRLDGEDPSQFSIAGPLEISMRRFLKLLPFNEILNAIEITFQRCSGSTYQRHKYFCGVCWNKHRESNAPISPAIQATQEAHGTPALRGSDGALQIEPPEQITAPALAGQAGVGERARKPRSLAKQLAESDSNESLNALAQGPQKPVRSQTVATTTHPSSKGCPLPCTDSSERAIAASAV